MSQIMTTAVYGQTQVIKNTYTLLAFTMLPTIAGALAGMQIPLESYRAHPFMWFFGSLIVALGFLFAAMKNKDSGLGVILTLVFTGVMGFTLAPSLQHTLNLANGAMIITQAAGLTALALFASAAYITITKKNFNFLGSFLYISLWVLVGASILAMFFQTPIVHLVISSVAVVLFTLYLLYDLSRLINGGEDNYVVATISIYLDIFNIFANLLSILGFIDRD